MAKKKKEPKTKAERATKRLTAVDNLLSEVRVLLREAETLLIAEEDRAGRRAARDRGRVRQVARR